MTPICRAVLPRVLAGVALPALSMLAVLAPAGPAAAQEEVRLPGEEAAVFNLAGRVEVLPGSGSDVVVEVVRGGEDGDRLELDTREMDGREALVVRYPGDRVVYPEMGRRSTQMLRVRDDGTFYGGNRGGDRVRISGSGSGLEAWADLRISVPAGVDLALYVAAGETDVGEVVGDLLVDVGSGSVAARGSRGRREIDTGSGSVRVQDTDGELLVDTGSGDVELVNVRGDDVVVDTGSGDVTGRGITAMSFEVDTGSGDILFSDVSSRAVELDTGSGEVEVGLLDDVDDLVVDTGSGDVLLRLPSSMGAELEVDTGSGGIDVDLPLEIREMKRDYLRGTVGDGRGEIRVDTGSGEVRIIRG